MAIEFARSEHISRGKGGNAVRSAAYALREALVDERLGVTHKFKDDGTLRHWEVILPDGSPPQFQSPAALINAMEAAEKRRDAQVARVVVIALDGEISDAERNEMARGFARQIFTDKGFPVLVCIHAPHDGENHHAHLIGGTRQLEPDGFASNKLRDTAFVRTFSRPFIPHSARERVGEFWRDFQNRWFSARGKTLTVDPVAPIPGEHIGPLRFRHPEDARIAANEQRRELNAKIARDPDAVIEHLRSQMERFDGRALDRFLAKHLPAEEREAVASDVRAKLYDSQRAALEKAARDDRVPSGWRELTVDDVARELSPEYAALVKLERQRIGRLKAASAMIDANEAHREDAQWHIARRWAELGFVRRTLHTIGAYRGIEWLQDIDVRQQEIRARQAEWGAVRWGIRRKEYLDTSLAADRALEAIRPAAQRELDRRRAVARNARAALENLGQRDKLIPRARRSYSRGPPL